MDVAETTHGCGRRACETIKGKDAWAWLKRHMDVAETVADTSSCVRNVRGEPGLRGEGRPA
eukprot:12439850-Alexandrium_andersonii.AAC.1